MGFFNKLEKLSEKYIEGFFKAKFAAHIQPAEIAKLLLREMRDNKNVSISRVYVPNEYTVFLGDADWDKIDSVRHSLSKEVQEFLTKKAKEKNYELVGDILVRFQHDSALSIGSITIESAFSENNISDENGSEGKIVETKDSTIVAEKNMFYSDDDSSLINQNTLNGMEKKGFTVRAELIQFSGTKEITRFPIGEQGVIIGRRRINEVYIPDTNVSRTHASIEFSDGNHFITDLGSTNGTFVNGARVSRAKLNDGDLIKVGATLLEYRTV